MPLIPNRNTPGIIPYILGVLWTLLAGMTLVAWSIDLMGLYTSVLNLGIASAVASLNMADRYARTRDSGWLHLSIPFALMFVVALFGYTNYLLTFVAQLAVAFLNFLTYHDAQS